MIGRVSMAAVVAAAAPRGQDGLENARMDFGKHKGELMVELPDSYLTWISRRKKGRLANWAPLADKVLESRHHLHPDRNKKQQLEASFTLTQAHVDCRDVTEGSSSPALESYMDSLVEEEVGGSIHINGDVFELISPGKEKLDENQREESSLEASNDLAGWSGCVELEALYVKQETQENADPQDVFTSHESSKNGCLKEGDNTEVTSNSSAENEAFENASSEREETPESSSGEEYRWFKLETPQTFENASFEREETPESSSGEEYRWFKLETPQTSSNEPKLASLVSNLEGHEDDTNARHSEFIRWCGDTGAVEDGKQIHSHIMKSGKRNEKFLLNYLVEMYGKWGQVEQARQVFDTILSKNTFSWNAMLEAYSSNGNVRQATELFRLMDLEGAKPNKLTFFALIDACTRTTLSSEVRLLHRRIQDNGFGSDVYIVTCLINIYGRCGLPREAESTFEEAEHKDVVTWTTAIGAYSRNREYSHALRLYNQMKLEGVKGSMFTLVTVLEACAGQRSLSHGLELHAAAVELGYESSTIVGTSIVHMYGRCGKLDSATSAFRRIPHRDRDVISWNTIIGAHLDNGRPVQALQMFEEMSPSVRPNSMTFAAALEACGLSGASPDYGKWIHGRVAGCRMENEAVVANALVEMYVRCGAVAEAGRVFQRIWVPSLGAFTAMICGSARCGNAGEAVSLLRRIQMEGLIPGYDAFMNVISVCGRRRLADVGWQQLILMRMEYGLSPGEEDREFLLDLFWRASGGRIRSVSFLA